MSIPSRRRPTPSSPARPPRRARSLNGLRLRLTSAFTAAANLRAARALQAIDRAAATTSTSLEPQPPPWARIRRRSSRQLKHDLLVHKLAGGSATDHRELLHR